MEFKGKVTQIRKGYGMTGMYASSMGMDESKANAHVEIEIDNKGGTVSLVVPSAEAGKLAFGSTVKITVSTASGPAES